MNRIKLGRQSSRVVLACAATALLAAGCNRAAQTAATTAPPLDALPLTTDTTAPAALAPTALPSAAPVRIARLAHPEEGYAYLDRAYAASDGYADAPPDYAVDYNGERPWIWRGGDQSERVVERTPEGLRYYYYEPGASQPYLIQDPDYGYAYSGGELVAVYGPDGRIEPYEIEQRRASQAGRYLAWAAGLYAASLHQQRVAVEQDHWRGQQAYITGQRNAWAQQQTRYQAWNDYHQAHAQEETAHWAPERDRRQAELVRYGAPQGAPAAGYQTARYQGGGDPAQRYQGGGQPQYGPFQGGGAQGQNGQIRQTAQGFTQPRGYPAAPPSGYGDDPAAASGAPAQAQADRRNGFDQRTADLQVQQRQAEQAHAGQVQAMQAQQAQARTAEIQRQATLQQSRMNQEAQRQAARQAHAGQMQAMHEQQMQARAAESQRQAAEGQRQAVLQQARAQAEAQRRGAEQAHAAQANEARVQAEAQHQAAMQQAQAENAQRRAAEQQAHAVQAQGQAQAHAAEQQAHAVQAQAQAQAHAAEQQAHAVQAAQRAAAPHQGAQQAHGPHGDHEHYAPGEQR